MLISFVVRGSVMLVMVHGVLSEWTETEALLSLSTGPRSD